MTAGRRKVIRYQVIQDVFAVIKSNTDILGNILDISNHGLSFHSLAHDELVDDVFQIDLFFSKNGYLTKNISCKKVFEQTKHSQMPFSSLMTRRIGVNFIKLNTRQLKQLKEFISHHTHQQVCDRRSGLDRRSKESDFSDNRGTEFNKNQSAGNEDRRYRADRRRSKK